MAAKKATKSKPKADKSAKKEENHNTTSISAGKVFSALQKAQENPDQREDALQLYEHYARIHKVSGATMPAGITALARAVREQ